MALVESPGLVAISVPFILFGLVAAAIGVRELSDGAQRVIAAVHTSVTDPVDPSEAPASGHALVVGTAADPAERLQTPVSGDEAVAYRHRLRQHSAGAGWWTVVDSGASTEFAVEGPVERLRVDPGGDPAETDLTASIELDGEEALSASQRDRLGSSGAYDFEAQPQALASRVDEPRRYEDGVIEPGDEIAVYGALVEDERGRRIDAAASREFRLAAEAPAEVGADDDLRSIAGSVAGGLFVFLFGAVFSGVGAVVLSDGLTVVTIL
ncbi:hypothetical protein [Halococcoides cellulosivorans]|uniref:Uncharacterized protein n=1 Tax=Halococcoides cellulosivorans TaxID=1679096 RepID=A0A2R4X3B0_9EURY|nr:hypothetical protein [Halococcoides cellulosivorans]AWB28291.1 hypothetical protein HARCEL1_11535 [Halococcoides cellulosivorans]